MNRRPLGWIGGAVVTLAAGWAAGPARGQTPGELEQTAKFVATFQNSDGGFASVAGGPSSLGGTSSAIRSLKYTGGSIPDLLACRAYVASCRDEKSGGFAPMPGGEPGVGITATGLMATAELKATDDATTEGAIRYFHEHVKTFEEIRIAVAGMEAAGKPSPDFPAWTAKVLEGRKADGTFGEGPGRARATGSAAAALLRMKVELEHREAVVAALREGQRPDGGWSEGDGASDLGTSYRVMRLMFMLKAKPDLGRLRSYIAGFRRENGGYDPGPGDKASMGGTYSCTIMLWWARQLDGEPAIVETAGFVPLFNGKDLAGWGGGDPSVWSARDGMLVGKTPGRDKNDFLATEADYGDFILALSFRLVGAGANSGVQFRSVRVPGHEMSGYQADIGEGYWGSLYDESRRNKVLAAGGDKATKALHPEGWNRYVVRAVGGQITLTLNGMTTVDYREPDPAIARSGKIAVQVHSGGPLEVQFKDILIQSLPTVADDDATTPGFHLRTLASPEGRRKYAVYFPEGYDGTRPFPALLSLHGSGQRGDDGTRQAQYGLGAAIAAHPERFPMVVVFPQARKDWKPDSPDGLAAIRALDEVMDSAKVDPDRVALTGLSMGGRGTWEFAATHPGRFAAIAPICGRGRPAVAESLKGTPTWAIVGDEDKAETVENARAMVRALRDVGGDVRLTEYRGVGHNSWDRAYADPALAAWLHAHSRPKP